MKLYTTSLRIGLLLLLLNLCPFLARAQSSDRPAKEHLLFAYFKGNGEDGLHLAYSRDGLDWKPLKNDNAFLKPTVGRDKLMRDPSILLGPDNTYHMVWTVSWQERGIGYASSKDLIHWSEQKYIPVMEQENGAINCWAPELFYDKAERMYLIVWATTIPGRFPDTDGQDSRGPAAPGWNHRIYYTKTRDFKTFSKTALFYEHGFNVIDAAIIRDGKSHVMLLKDETNKPFKPQKNIRLAFSHQAAGPYSAPTEPITGSYWAEGPTAIKIGARWFVYFDKYTEKRYGLIVSTDLKSWTDLSDQLAMPKGMRHGTVFRVPEKVVKGLLSLE
jgi:hypothetical protein